jgi:hypothetical protein
MKTFSHRQRAKSGNEECVGDVVELGEKLKLSEKKDATAEDWPIGHD